MAVRLNVVMNQSPPASPIAQRVGEGIVGEMIGRPGIDMVLVNTASLEDTHSTDLLTLESITGDFVYLDWKAPEDVLALLSRCKIDGKRFPHAGDPAAATATASATSPRRRVYIFDLNQYSSPNDVCNAVYELLRLRQVRTFSLLGSVTASPATKTPESKDSIEFRNVEQQPLSEDAGPASLLEIAPKTSNNATTPPDRAASTAHVASSPQGDSGRGLSDDQLDALVDQLNADELG